MTLLLGTICLNEMEWLPKLYEQHHDWPGMRSWVFVEGADPEYARVNPDKVRNGLSTDGTTEFLERLARVDERVKHYRFSFNGYAGDKAQAKSEMRNIYLQESELVRPESVLMLDSDEFYTRDHQAEVSASMSSAWMRGYNACVFKFRHPWKPPTCDWGLLDREIVGGFWDMPHCHGWKWEPGMRHTSYHMHPTPTPRMTRVDGPQCVHMAFASRGDYRAAKHRYYEERGEAQDDKRKWYVTSRKAWETWAPERTDLMVGGRMAQVVDYKGPFPEVFR